MLAGIDQTLAFEKGMRGHDDAPDADEVSPGSLFWRINFFTPCIETQTGRP